MDFETTGSMRSGTGLQVKNVCPSAGDGRMLVAGRAQSPHTGRRGQREARRGLAFAGVPGTCVHVDMVEKTAVRVGPSCWLRGSDLRTPAQSSHLETEGNVSVTQRFRDTCRGLPGA